MKQGIRVAFIGVSCLELVMGILEMCNYELPLKRIILWGFFVVYLINLWGNDYTKAEMAAFVVTIILGILLYANTGINTGIKAPVYIMALKGIDRRKLLQCFLWTSVLVAIIIMIGALFFGIGDVHFWVLTKTKGISKACFCLGFSNPNRLQLLIYSILSCFLLLYGRNSNRIVLVSVGAAYFIMAYLTDCKTGMLIGIFVLVAVICVRKVKTAHLSDWIMALFIIGLVFMLIISFLAAAKVEKGFWLEQINRFISGRMNQLEYYTNEEFYNLPYLDSWKLFSDRNNKNSYDMGYIYIFYYYGIIMGAVYLIFVVNAVEKARRKKDSLGMVLIMGLCIYLFMETGYYSNYLTRDFLLMTSAVVLWGDYEETIHKHIQPDYSN